MSSGLVFIIICAFGTGFWTVFMAAASHRMNAVLGAVLSEFTAVMIGACILLPLVRSSNIQFSSKGILLVVVAGVCVFLVDYFALRAYSRGLAVSIGGPIHIGGSILVTSFIGFGMGEEISLIKICAILMIIVGASILAAVSI